MKPVLFSPAARQDLDSIFEYTVETWSFDQAVCYTKGIQDICQALGAGTLKGRAVPIKDGYHKVPAGAHMIYYKVGDDGGLVIVRILHQRMDVDRHL